jgi:hypothetical protein
LINFQKKNFFNSLFYIFNQKKSFKIEIKKTNKMNTFSALRSRRTISEAIIGWLLLKFANCQKQLIFFQLMMTTFTFSFDFDPHIFFFLRFHVIIDFIMSFFHVFLQLLYFPLKSAHILFIIHSLSPLLLLVLSTLLLKTRRCCFVSYFIVAACMHK